MHVPRKIRPLPTNKEIILDPKKVIISKTDKKGVIQYANDYFIEISGYSKAELLHKPHNIIRHPDMPKVVFKILWEKLHKGENIYAVIKNLTKNGDFYWVVTKFETSYDENGNIVSHTARRKTVPEKVKQIANSIYKTIVAIEKIDPKLAEESFYETLEKYQLTYDDFFVELSGMSEEEVTRYFFDEKQNINVSREYITVEEDILLDIDFEKIENKMEDTTSKENNEDFHQKIQSFKAQIKALKKAIPVNNSKKATDLNRKTKKENELKQLMRELKNKKHT